MQVRARMRARARLHLWGCASVGGAGIRVGKGRCSLGGDEGDTAKDGSALVRGSNHSMCFGSGEACRICAREVAAVVKREHLALPLLEDVQSLRREKNVRLG